MWYSASLFFESIHTPPAPPREHLWEEIVHLIDAESEEQALAKADAIGRASELNYQVDSGDNVKWRFVKTESVALIEMQELKDGAEIFSRFLTAEEAHSLLTPFEE
jgi:hypothetical protein